MTAARRLKRRMSGAVVLVLIAVGANVARAQPARETASSEFRSGYGAAQAADGIADGSGNYWQTLQRQDKGAWWQQDLGRVLNVQGVKIVWARYEDKVHCPPASAVIETSLTGEEGSWKVVRNIAPEEIPRDEQPYDADRQWLYAFPEPTEARYLRLSFPDGEQPEAKYPGFICLGEVEVLAPGMQPRIVTIEGSFGRAEVNVTFPAVVRLYLRGPGGMNVHSLLAQSGPYPWVRGSCTYVVGQDGRRYESRLTRPENVELSEEGGRTVVRIRGVRLSAGRDEPPVATEDWTLSAPGDGSQLVWKIVRRWERDFASVMSGSPALFFAFHVPQSSDATTSHSVTSTIWYDPLRIAARPSVTYAACNWGWCCRPRALSKNHVQTVKDRDTWAIYKLWTDWHAPADLRLEVEGGHLYRRGGYSFVSEAGAVTDPDAVRTCRAGQQDEITLKISAADKRTTGYQLAVDLPDKDMETSLTDFYGSLFNGGTINDQKGFDYGNESDGFYYSGASWAQALALAAGMPAGGQVSSHPYHAAQAFREHLAHIFSLVDDQGRDHFGYNHSGQWVECQLLTILATRTYLLHSGDLAFVRQNLSTLERMLEYFIQRRNAQGLFSLDSPGAHWYYDDVGTSGVNTYYNAFFYKAAGDLAEMEAAAERVEKAGEYRELARSLHAAFNALLWKEDAPGGPRYLDWIDVAGTEVAYFCDLCQWPAVAVGLASPEQARKIVATADRRIAELEIQYGYHGGASLSALWPVPQKPPESWQNYANGGHGLSPTYWEILARIRAGDAEGAHRRLKRFAERAARTSWVGNWFTMQGQPQAAEAYLADMVVVPAALIYGILGVTPSWDRLEVTPCLPAGWPRAEADILYKGRRHRVRIEGAEAQIEPLEKVIDLPLAWLMDANLQQTGPGNAATVSNIDFGDGGSLELTPTPDNRDALGIWKLDEDDGTVLDAGPYRKHGTVLGEGVSRGQPARAATSKSYRFDGRGRVAIQSDGGVAVGPYTPHNDSLTFSPWESFTLQCWFKTEAADTQVLVANASEYCLLVSGGKLAAWIMQDGGQTGEARGSRLVADGHWHHVAAVCDRAAQQLSLYLDGKLDTPDGTPAAENPADISTIAASKWPASLTLAGLGSRHPLLGWLDEVSIFSGALEASKLSFRQDYPWSYGDPTVNYTATGTYQSPTCDWTVPAKLVDLTVAAELNGGQATATVETSADGFGAVRSHVEIAVRDGVNRYPLDALQGVSREIRVRFDLVRGNRADQTPVVDGFRITGEPAKETPGK